MGCKHLWIDMNDGSYDQQCTVCGIKRMRAVMVMPRPIEPVINISIKPNINQTTTDVIRHLKEAVMKELSSMAYQHSGR